MNPPLQRHVSLQPLSRDHYVGLVRAQHLIRSAQAGPDERRAALREFITSWDQEIRAHFADEEALLPPLVEAADADRLRREHERLRALATDSAARLDGPDPGADWVRELGQALNDHIRWEERELFPRVESRSAPGQLELLEAETSRIEESRPRAARRRRGHPTEGGGGARAAAEGQG